MADVMVGRLAVLRVAWKVAWWADEMVAWKDAMLVDAKVGSMVVKRVAWKVVLWVGCSVVWKAAMLVVAMVGSKVVKRVALTDASMVEYWADLKAAPSVDLTAEYSVDLTVVVMDAWSAFWGGGV